ncbi:hypothetical protein JXI42_03820 [bacterium]|nr:hypothetical protein [bacterium]
MASKNKIKFKPYHIKFHLLFYALVLINLILVSLAILSYREHFPFWKYPFSTLGETVTVSGFPNDNSLFMFNISMMLSGIIMAILAIAFLEEKRARNRVSKVVLCLISAIGFFVASSPHDIHRMQHIYGTAIMFGSLWGLSVVFLTELKPIVSKKMFTIGQLILQVPILSYAVLFVLIHR